MKNYIKVFLLPDGQLRNILNKSSILPAKGLLSLCGHACTPLQGIHYLA